MEKETKIWCDFQKTVIIAENVDDLQRQLQMTIFKTPVRKQLDHVEANVKDQVTRTVKARVFKLHNYYRLDTQNYH